MVLLLRTALEVSVMIPMSERVQVWCFMGFIVP